MFISIIVLFVGAKSTYKTAKEEIESLTLQIATTVNGKIVTLQYYKQW